MSGRLLSKSLSLIVIGAILVVFSWLLWLPGDWQALVTGLAYQVSFLLLAAFFIAFVSDLIKRPRAGLTLGFRAGNLTRLIKPLRQVSYDKPMFYQVYLLDNMSESFIAVNSLGKPLYYNRQAQELFGQELPGSGSLLLDRLGLEPALLDSICQSHGQTGFWQGERRIMINGAWHTFLHRITSEPAGSNAGDLLIISSDISELVENRERAEIANFTQTQLLANISHEIRTPMIGILGSVNLLEQSRLDRLQLENVSIIRECGEHLLRIINEILDLSKIELGIESVASEPCRLADIGAGTISIVEPLAREKGLYVTADLQELPNLLLLTDQVKLRQILLNILHNSLKFTTQGGIHIKARLEKSETGKEELVVIIADTGIGIDKNKIKDVFAPFIQGDSSSSRSFGGTGLGLYICQKLIDLMKGDILLESEQGLGTTCHIRIPVSTLSETSCREGVDQTTVRSCCQTQDILSFYPVQVMLVEDNHINQRIVAQMLQNYGFEVVTAQHGLECLRLLQTRSFDVILMDMQMPVMDGYEATQYISQDLELQRIPVIAMTAHALAGDRDKCLRSGCSDYIAKPFRSEELLAVINRNLHNVPLAPLLPDISYDQMLIELLPEFIESLNEMISGLYRALEARDAEALQSISHDIKGSAGLYGFKRVSELAALIEQAARDKLLHKVGILAANLTHIYDELYSQVG